MQSSSSRVEKEKERQESLRKQIAALQAQLKDIPQEQPSVVPTSPQQKRPEPTLLVPPTPSPKKRKFDHRQGVTHPAKQLTTQPSQYVSGSMKSSRIPALSENKVAEMRYPQPAPSNLLSKLASLGRQHVDTRNSDTVTRTTSFTERPLINGDTFDEPSIHRRDENLALVEDLEPGPIDYSPPADDPDFKQLEPNSGIRLISRSILHKDFQDHLRGRYYLSPSRLYSAVRILPDKQSYDVPVPGDWITVAVVAERGPLKFSRAPVTVNLDEDENGVRRQEEQKGKKGKGKEDSKPIGKKYVNIKLIDFGARSSSSATGGKATIRGDAFLSLLLFESDRFDLVTEDGNTKPRKVYKGGSRGAFESMSKLKEGDVIALLNPKVLKPFQRSNDSPHPINNILALTPESASSIMVIGRSRDLGMCMVAKKDGKPCGSWCDKRVSDVCEWHIQNAVERRRAGRAEFSIGTTGMSTSSAPKRKPAYDPARQWGLKPAEAESGSSTYVLSGHIVNGSGMDSRSLYATENIGRNGQAKAKRKLSGKDADRALKNLLERDKEGMKAVMKAREVGMVDKGEGSKGKDKKRKRTEEDKRDKLKRSKCQSSESDSDGQPAHKEIAGITKNAYSAEIIKQLGFDPIARAGQHRGDSGIQKKLDTLAAVQAARKAIALGPRPGQRMPSSIVTATKKSVTDLVILDSDDDLPTGPLEQMVELDD